MTTKLENQSQNQQKDQLNNKKTGPIKIIESLLNFHTSLADINSAFEEFFEQINTNSAKLERLKNKMGAGSVMWRLEDIKHELPIILLAAGISDKPQYLQFENHVVEISKPKDKIIDIL
jgi:predicted  nucleic acid-binding Zn-ribbon protein